MLFKRGLFIAKGKVAKCWKMPGGGGAGELLCHYGNLTTEDWVLPAKFNFAKGRTLCPSQHLTRQAVRQHLALLTSI